MRSAVLASLVATSASALSLGGLALQRPAFSASPITLNTSEFQFVIDDSISLLGDWDVVSVDLSYYGIPWSSFLYEEPLPVSWATRLDNAVKGVDSYELPVVLQFPILGSDKRSCPVSNATDYPGSTSPGVNDFYGCTRCFDYSVITNPVASFVRQGFVNYALAVSYAFNTTGTLGLINFGIDANRYLEDGCSAANVASFKEFTNQVYATLKELYPTMAVFPSFSLESMMQVNNGQACKETDFTTRNPSAALLTCARAGYAALAGFPRDTFAWSALPSLSAGASIPAWYLSAPLSVVSAADRVSMVVTSTGALATTLSVNFANSSGYAPPLQCTDLVPSTPEIAGAWLDLVLAATKWTPTSQTFVVNFKTARDTLFDSAMACPCTAPIPPLQP